MFGRPGRRLFGMFHSRAKDPVAGGVLLCNPFGQEAIRAHRLLRVLAERLARAGFDCLRFDYFATGDSAGDDEQGDLDGWLDDVRTAHGELLRRTRASRVTWVGSRLGASIAVLALTGRAEPSPRLVLWDPIVEGRDYLTVLQVKHVESLEKSYSVPDPSWRRRLAVEPGAFMDEAIGFGMSAALRQQIDRLSLVGVSLPPDLELHVLARPEDTSVNAWVADLQTRAMGVHPWPVSHLFDWTAPEAMNTSLVPSQALDRMMASICD